jgi:2-dehydropantoate 2-reductase
MGARQNLRVGVIGAGAVGLFYAGHFFKAGAAVTIITRTPDDYSAVSKDDLRSKILVESCDGNFDYLVDVIDLYNPDAQINNFDVLIVATKVYDDLNIVDFVAPFVQADTTLMLIQNGFGIEQPFLERFTQPIIRGLAFLCSNRMSKQHVRHLDYGSLTLGYVQGSSMGLSEDLKTVLSNMAVHVSWVSNINVSIWEKLVWNVPFNPLSVSYGGVTTDILVNDTDICNRVRCIMEEVCLAAKADGVDLPDSIVDEKIAATQQMAPYQTSMCLDFLAGLPLETEAIVGNLVRFCNKNKVPIPYISNCLSTLLDKKKD